jgi:beta-N-acetylhexosaminidase
MIDSDYSIAELVVMGFQGKSLSAETIATLEKEKAQLFILFAHNYESKEQLIALTDEIQVRTRGFGSRLPSIISADQEGGRVQRFRNGFTLLPPALSIGKTNSPNLAFDLGRIQARELFAAGIQLNYAPVCDINTNPSNPVIGDRAFGDTADTVTRMASAIVRGHLSEGVEACIKHFPGHGDTHLDSHESLPTVNTPLETLQSREWIPFHRAMKSGANFLMSAHILLPHLDQKNPGTLSPTFLKNYLRGTLMYQGVVMSDDMEMGAITKNFGAEEAPILALQAGCDVLCYRSESAAVIAIESIRKALTEKRLDPLALKISIDRVRRVRSHLKLAQETLTPQERLARIGNEDHAAWIRDHITPGSSP